MKPLFLGLALSLVLSSSAFASYTPITYAKSRAELAAACATLGAKGEGYGLAASSGAYGCRNTENGGAVQCEENGQCRDFSGDPRWKHIQILLQGGSNTPMRAKLI